MTGTRSMISGNRGAITDEWALHTKTPAFELKKVGHEDANNGPIAPIVT